LSCPDMRPAAGWSPTVVSQHRLLGGRGEQRARREVQRTVTDMRRAMGLTAVFSQLREGARRADGAQRADGAYRADGAHPAGHARQISGADGI
jgi:hypothetical protein